MKRHAFYALQSGLRAFSMLKDTIINIHDDNLLSIVSVSNYASILEI